MAEVLQSRQQLDEVKTLLTQMRSSVDDRVGKNNERLDAIDAETKALVEKINKRIDEIELAANRPGVVTIGKSDEEVHKAEVKSAFLSACRKGYANISGEERKTLREIEPSAEEKKTYFSSDDTTGGFFAPIDFTNILLKNIVLISRIRQEATVIPTSREAASVGRRLGTPRAAWGNEQTVLTPTQSAYGREDIPTHKLTAYAVISNQDLEDNIFPLEDQLMSDLSEEFARAEGQQFVIGTGASPYPEGLLSNPNIIVNNSGSSTGLTGDGLITMAYNLKSPYAPNAKWYLNRHSIGATRLLKDSQGRYLLQPGIALGSPSTILDMPYVEVPDMPDVATGTTPILFGDLKKAYMIVDRVGMSLQRLDQLFAIQDAIGFKARMRVGGQVVLPEAIQKMAVHS